MAGTIATAYVKIVPSTKGISSGISQELDGAAPKVGKSFGGKFSAAAGKILKVGFSAVAAGAVAVISGAVKETAELEQNLGGSEAVYGKYAKDVQKIAKDAYKNMGTSQSEYLAGVNKMGSLFQGAGLSQQKSMDLTSKAMQRAADVASVMGIDTTTAMESITGAAKGNFTMMDNLGVAMNATTLQAYALEKGMNFDWKTASNAEKSELAMQMFFDRTEQYAGNFAKESDHTISGAFGQMKAAGKDFLAALGTGDDIEGASQRLAESVGTMIKNAAPVIGQAAKGLFKAIFGKDSLSDENIEGIKTAFQGLFDTFGEMGDKIKGVFSDLFGESNIKAGDVLQAILTGIATGIKGIVIGVSYAVIAVAYAVKTIIKVVTTVKNFIVNAINAVKTVFNTVKTFFVNSFTAIGNVGKTVFNAIKTVVTTVGNAIKTVWTGVKTAFAAVFTWIGDKASSVFKRIKSIGGSIAGAVGKAWDTVMNGIKNVINTIIIRPLNGAIGIINKIPGVNIGTISELATGGIVTAPTLAMVGEGREPEAVMPLSKLSSYIASTVDSAGASGSFPTEITLKDSDGTFLGKLRTITDDKITINNIRYGVI
jgi:phage-related protein